MLLCYTRIADVDYSSLPKFRKKLPEKLKQIRERAGLTPEEFAPHVHAKDGRAVEKYEKGKGDLPGPVLMRYWKLSDVTLRWSTLKRRLRL